MEKNEMRNAEAMQAEHAMFGQVWKLFNAIRKDGGSDTGWKACVDEAGKIAKNNPGRLSKELLLSVMDEMEAELKEKDPKVRLQRYRAAAKAFQESWDLYVSMMADLDVNAVSAYCGANPGKFGRDLGAAVYKAAYVGRYEKGSFAGEAYRFYEKHRDKLGTDALAELEVIIDRHPGHTLQMLELYDSLKSVDEKREAAQENALTQAA